MIKEKQWAFARKIVSLMKKYKDNPELKPSVEGVNGLDYNVWLLMKGEITIESLGNY